MEENQPQVLSQPKSDHVRELRILFDRITGKVEVAGHLLDKVTCFQMLLEAGHIIIGMPAPDTQGKPN